MIRFWILSLWGLWLPGVSLWSFYRSNLEAWEVTIMEAGWWELQTTLHCIMPPANKLVVFPIPFLISLLQTSLKEQGAIALTRVYSWGWGEGSGHCCCHHQLPRMNCPGDISEVRVHSCILGATQLPHPPGFSRQKWSSLCRTVCVLWRPNQILESHYYLIIWKKKFLDFFFVQFKHS